MDAVRELQEHNEIWRRQCARNLMDCYELAMEVLGGPWAEERPPALDALTRLMVDGMTSVRTAEDERSFYRTAAALCRQCAGMGGQKGAMFRVYKAIFEDMGDRKGAWCWSSRSWTGAR